MSKRYKRGYTQGVYDMFHVGHLNLINAAKNYCDYLIVAVNSDSLVSEYKKKVPVINEEDRMYIINNIKAVDETLIAQTLDKITMLELVAFDVVFIGDDWKGNVRWEHTEKTLKKYNIDVVYLPYTRNVSSTRLSEEKDKKVDD